MWRRSSRRRTAPSADSRADSIAAKRSASARKSESAVSSSTRRRSFSSFATTLSSHQALETLGVERVRARFDPIGDGGGVRHRRRVYGSRRGAERRQRDATPGRKNRHNATPPTKEPAVMATATHVEIDRARIKELTEREAARLERAHAGLAGVLRARVRGASSAALPRRTSSAIRGRSTSRTGRAPQVWDVDGNEYLDFHNGFGSMVQGHAHPVISKAVHGADRARHPLRRADRGRDRRRRGARTPLGAAEVALRQLRLGGDDGRDPDRAGGDRAATRS